MSVEPYARDSPPPIMRGFAELYLTTATCTREGTKAVLRTVVEDCRSDLQGPPAADGSTLHILVLVINGMTTF